jgi:uncharacterized protein (TIGR02147 family)
MGSVFDAYDYRRFLIDELESARFGRGSRARLAKHLGAHMSFISAVLSGKQDLTPEHGLKVGLFLDLDPEEIHWFILLINRDRAGTTDLKRYYQEQLNQLRTKRSEIQNQVKAQSEISEADAHLYYSNWYNIAVHMGLRIPELQEPEQIAAYLGITRKQVKASLQVLEKIGFITLKNGKWQVQQIRFHLGQYPHAMRIQHMNWRQVAIRALDKGPSENLHYSALYSIDLKTFQNLKSKILALIKESEPEILKARDQELIALNFDLFQINAGTD